METKKVCSKCKVMKELSLFHNLKTGVFGKHSNCKDCRNKYRKDLSFKKPLVGKIKCEQCNIIKTVSEFYKDRSKSTGLQSYCICCQKEKVYESTSKLNTYIKTQLSLIKNSMEDTSKDTSKDTSQDTSKNILKNILKDTSKDNPTLTLEDILEIYNSQNKECALTNELLTYYSGKCLTKDKYEKKFNIKIQKKENKKPYTKNNVILVGNVIYKMINNMELKEFKRICNLVKDSTQ